MRFTVYPEGAGNRAVTIASSNPLSAARVFAEEHADERDGTANLVVTPADDEAKEIPDWATDQDEPMHRLYMVDPIIAMTEWTARRVTSFHGEETGK